MRRLLFFIVILIAWQSLGWFVPDNRLILSTPVEVVQAFFTSLIDGNLFADAMASIIRVVVGFFFAVILAIPLALLAAYKSSFGYYIMPIVNILRPIPPIAWIPIAILIFGLGDNSAFFIVFLGSFFPIFTNTYFGAISLPTTLKNVALSYELSKYQFVNKILFYYYLPYIFTGLKIGIGMAWMSVIAAELIGSQSGLGYFIQMNRLMLRTDNILVGMISIGLIGYLLHFLITILENKIISWNKN